MASDFREIAEQLVPTYHTLIVDGAVTSLPVLVERTIKLAAEATRQVDSSHLHDWIECRMERPLQATTDADVVARMKSLLSESTEER